jgi:CBS domain-containing protein
MNATVKDVMTTYVVAAGKGASFKDLAANLGRFRISAFPVVDEDGTVIGVVSETDLLRKEALDLAREALAEGHGGVAPTMADSLQQHPQQADSLTASDLMTRPAVTITPDESVEHAARLMYNCRVKRLPVVDERGHLVGIISRADVLSVFARTDDEVRDEVANEVIAREFLLDPRQFTVTVRAGVVTLRGGLGTETLRHDLVQKVRHVQGVVAVRDRLRPPGAC